MTALNDHRTPVLIVGGGVTGLSMALFLARQGLRPTLVERHPTTAIMPQARAFNPRTLEIYRAYGLEAEIRQRVSILADMPDMIGAATLAGAERFHLTADQQPPAGLSPTDWAMIDQDELELLLRAHAEAAGADVRFATSLTSFDEHGEGVVATVRESGTGNEYRVRADYLVAADGHRAGIRHRLGIGVDGPGVLHRAAHFLFDADLTEVLRGRRFHLAYFDEPVPGTVLVPLRQWGRWMLGVPYASSDERPEDYTEQRCAELVRLATGVPDLDLELVPPVPGRVDKITHLGIGGWVAHRYRAGRVFVIGDAAHVVPPAGSYGANTGIADAHNLAWKLLAVINGHAGPALLDSYETERRPVATATLDHALALLRARQVGAAAELDTVDDITMIFGYRYASSAVHTEPSTTDGPTQDPTTCTGEPGLRAPHVWLQRNGTKLSTIDLYDGAWCVLAGPGGTAWRAAAEAAAARLGVPLTVHQLGTDLHDADGRFLEAHGIGGAGVTVVRPDGFVAWRSADLPADPRETLTGALAGLLRSPLPR
ncbi:FAD-dependent oxidoreductase [Amycolatopsis sp. NPDC059027]|uniref:FAD-dependent oxidoreductase n=1 Tax=Amycolatopsis sp. NPDC059027 TaxID=3346709 RepID=UPI00366F9B72